MIDTIEMTSQATSDKYRVPCISAPATSPDGVVVSADLKEPRALYPSARILSYNIKLAISLKMAQAFTSRCHELLIQNYPDADLDSCILPIFMEKGVHILAASSTKEPKVYGEVRVGSQAWVVGRLFPFRTQAGRVGLNFRLIHAHAADKLTHVEAI